MENIYCDVLVCNTIKMRMFTYWYKILKHIAQRYRNETNLLFENK